MAMASLAAGLSLGFSLIVAIGAQNAFVLRQGLKQQGVFLVCLICALSDAVLIVVGVYGFNQLLMDWPGLEGWMRLGGGLFLLAYGLRSLWLAWRGQAGLEPEGQGALSGGGLVLTTLAFTWLNPHVYLDTIVLMGTVSTGFADQRAFFAGGAVLASFLFFFGLGYGARLLSPWVRKAVFWRLLDLGIAVVMLTLARGLLNEVNPSQLL